MAVRRKGACGWVLGGIGTRGPSGCTCWRTAALDRGPSGCACQSTLHRTFAARGTV